MRARHERCGVRDDQVVHWLSPLIVNREQIDEAVDIFEQALGETN